MYIYISKNIWEHRLIEDFRVIPSNIFLCEKFRFYYLYVHVYLYTFVINEYLNVFDQITDTLDFDDFEYLIKK